MIHNHLPKPHMLSWTLALALGWGGMALAQVSAPPRPTLNPVPIGPAGVATGAIERGTPAEVETPPTLPMQRLAMPQPMPVPDMEDERQAQPIGTIDVVKKQCPQTIVMKAPPPNQTTPYAADFPSLAPQWIEQNFGGTTPDRHVRHTFDISKWCKDKCCELHKGKLEVTVKALIHGSSNSSFDSGNDSISIWKNGSPLFVQYLYSSFPVTPGTVKTITIPVSPSWLDGCRLSFQVQDDSSLLDAKLVLTGCCVKPNVKQ